jgi:predicted GNAT family acetyltransferase
MTENLAFNDNTAEQRFEVRQGGQLAGFAQYQATAGGLRFTHTEVMPEFEGQGVGSRLARAALDEVRRRGLKAVPQCEFIAGYIRKNPQYQDLVA